MSADATGVAQEVLAPLGETGFARRLAVSDGVMAQLRAFEAVLRAQRGRINLLGPAEWDDLWRRHMLDSAQLLALLPNGAKSLTDLGSGAGFPGLVLAIMSRLQIRLVEAHGRKAAFLVEAARAAGVADRVTVHHGRIEALPPGHEDVITARACAPLGRLLGLARPLAGPGGCCLFPKGRRWREELTHAGKQWYFAARIHASLTDAQARILEIRFHDTPG